MRTELGTRAAFPKVRLVLLIEAGTHLILDAFMSVDGKLSETKVIMGASAIINQGETAFVQCCLLRLAPDFNYYTVYLRTCTWKYACQFHDSVLQVEAIQYLVIIKTRLNKSA